MGCGVVIVKYVLLFVNLLFALIGISLAGIGIAFLVRVRKYTDVIPAPIEAVIFALIVLGSTVFIIACLGCCGAIEENCCMLSTFSILMAILAAPKIYLATMVYQNPERISRLFIEWLTDAFNNNIQEPFYMMQIVLQCCGTTGAPSYGGTTLPPSCCDQDQTCTVDNSYRGCFTILTEYLETYRHVIGPVLLIFIIVELVTIIIAVFITCTSRNNNRMTYKSIDTSLPIM